MKNWYESKTLWFNIAALLVAVLGPVAEGFGYTGDVPTNLEVYIVPAIALVNMALRYFFTSAPLRE